MGDVHFSSIRSDWYAANTLLPRLVVNAVLGREPLRLIGFPAQWIPAAVHYGLEGRDWRRPNSYLPLFSDLSPEKAFELVMKARDRGASRPLLESSVALDPVLADFVYIVDHKLAAAGYVELRNGSNLLNTWHSFARPEIVQLQERMCRHALDGETLLMLPCSRRRPYSESRTHARLLRTLEDTKITRRVQRVVVTALGVVPEAYWRDPIVMSYDAGAVDLWRVYQLLRVFFEVNRPGLVVDCLSFKPYSDMLSLLRDGGVIKTLIRPLSLRWRAFHVTLR